MSRRGRAIHRVDLTAKSLIAHAKTLGWDFIAHDGSIDGNLYQPATGEILFVDWKSPGADLTPAQGRLVARGIPIRFISTVDQLEGLRRR